MTLNSGNPTKKSFLRKFFSPKENHRSKRNTEATSDSSEMHHDSSPRPLSPDSISDSMGRSQCQALRVFVATWNVGGKSPHDGFNLDAFLQIDNASDIYVLGFQEIVPLNAGNVLVVEDNEPAEKWLSFINQSLNQSQSNVSRKKKSLSPLGSSLPFQKPFFKKFCDTFRTESEGRLKACNCSSLQQRKYCNDSWAQFYDGDCSSEEDEDGFGSYFTADIAAETGLKYGLVMAKQMVGIFLTIWAKKEVLPYVGHSRVSCTGRGIMGYLGNKGSISVSMTIHQTSFCFVCSHLASGEKEGDELRRNADVIEILKSTQFPRICRSSQSWVPEKIVDHDRVIWLGDLNYRIALSYSEARKLVDTYDWDALFDNDQLKIEREAGRVFRGWSEGKIYFPPTYKYSCNSDTYAGETAQTKNKRRTPAWCDRVLWRGEGIKQDSYRRLESRFSDHRPVCSSFMVNVQIVEPATKRALLEYNHIEVACEEYLPLTMN